MLWTKRANQCIIFQTSECSNESSPNFSCHFSNHKVRVYSNFALLFSVIKDKTSVFFLLKSHILQTETAHRSEIFGIQSSWVKIHKIPHVIFESTSQFFYNFASFFSVTRDNSSILFLAETLYYCDERNPSKCQILDFPLHQIWTLISSFC